MYCTNCGNQVPDESAFCSHCGAPLKGGTPPQQTAAPSPVLAFDPMSLKHRSEQSLYVACFVITIIAAIPMVFLLVGIPYLIGAVFGLILMFYMNYANEMSRAVRVTERNFPEIYNKSVEFAQKLGMEKVPEVYITQKNGVLNAFASWLFGRKYIQINSELLDIAYMENKDFDTVFFALAHEFGHLYYDHVSLKYNLSIFYGKLVPFLGTALGRAREYSCDKMARYLTDDKNSVECIAALAAGRHLYKYVDAADYLETVKSTNYTSLELFARWLVNAFTDHPITPYRLEGIMKPMGDDGRLF